MPEPGAGNPRNPPEGHEMTDYRVEFGPDWPVPPITVDFTDRGAAINAVTEHALPHLRTALAEKGRPELADCFFRTDRELTEGSFMWINLAEGVSALFCPARLTAEGAQR